MFVLIAGLTIVLVLLMSTLLYVLNRRSVIGRQIHLADAEKAYDKRQWADAISDIRRAIDPPASGNFSTDVAEVTLQAVAVFENLIHRLELASPVELEGLKESLHGSIRKGATVDSRLLLWFDALLADVEAKNRKIARYRNGEKVIQAAERNLQLALSEHRERVQFVDEMFGNVSSERKIALLSAHR